MKQDLLKLADALTETKTQLSPQQIRLVKSTLVALIELSHTNEEEAFFNLSKELFQTLAGIMKHSHFHNTHSVANRIPYAEQAIELSIEILSDDLYSQKLKKYDQ